MAKVRRERVTFATGKMERELNVAVQRERRYQKKMQEFGRTHPNNHNIAPNIRTSGHVYGKYSSLLYCFKTL